MEPPLKKRQKSVGVEPTICVMGRGGRERKHPKFMFSGDTYSTRNLFASDTERPVSHVLPWRGLSPHASVDLCGFSDSEVATLDLEVMVAYLQADWLSMSSCFS